MRRQSVMQQRLRLNVISWVFSEGLRHAPARTQLRPEIPTDSPQDRKAGVCLEDATGRRVIVATLLIRLPAMRVFVVEDDPMIGEAVVAGLAADGYAVDWVRDGRSAELSMGTHPYSLVLLDIGL